MALRTRPDASSRSRARGVATEQISNASRLVCYLTGFAVQPNKAIVGRNAFAHESGIHQDGVLKNPLTYEIMTPAVGGPRRAPGCPSASCPGRRGLQGKLQELGHELEGEALDARLPAGHRAGRRQEGGHRRRPRGARRGRRRRARRRGLAGRRPGRASRAGA